MGGPGVAQRRGLIQCNLTFVKDPLHILHLEDSEADAVLISHELEKAGLHVEAHRVVTREEFTRELDEHRPDVILSDHGLPNFDGFTALKLAKEKCPETPFIFVAESLHGESALETIKNGAADYILKSQVPQRLLPALQKALEHARESAYADALRQSEERFKLVAKATMDVIYDWDIPNNYLFWNEGFHKSFGYRPDDIQPHIEDWEARIHPADRERVVARLKDAQNRGEHDWMDEYRFRRGDGSYAYVLDRGYFISDREGKPARMVGAMMDISERRRMEREFEIHNRQQAAVATLGQKALSGADLPTLFSESSKQVRKALQIEVCCLFETRAKSGEGVLQSGMDDRNKLPGQAVWSGSRGSVLVEAVSAQKLVAVVDGGAESLQPISEPYG